MRFVSDSVFLLLLVFGACLAIGCSEKSTGPDNNLPPAAGKHYWSKQFGDEHYQRARAVAVDASGNVIITGYFYGTVDFGGGAFKSACGDEVFVAKFGSDGVHLWSTHFGGGGWKESTAISVDASGNVIIAGFFLGTVDFGGGELTSAGNDDIFVAKFGSDGTHLWSKRFGDGEKQEALAIGVDASGNVIVTGSFEGTVDFGGGVLKSASGKDIFVAKFGSDGTHLWSKRFGDGGKQASLAIGIDTSGNVIITGYFYGIVDFGGGVLASEGLFDIFVAKFGADGAHLWSKRFGDKGYQAALAIGIDASENVIITGSFERTVDFGGGALTSVGAFDIFAAKLESGGAHLWSKRFGDEDWQEARAVAADASGNVIVAGEFYDTVDFGGGTLASTGLNDICVAKFGADGTHLWSKRFGDENYQGARAVGVDASGNVIITGYFYGTVDFGGGALRSAGNNDIFVSKFGP